jgi:hypothetical protein
MSLGEATAHWRNFFQFRGKPLKLRRILPIFLEWFNFLVKFPGGKANLIIL